MRSIANAQKISPDNHLDGFSERQYGWQNKPTPNFFKGGDEMRLYGAIDLHSNNNVTVLIDEKDKVVYQKRLANDLPLIVEQLSPYAPSIEGIVVESTYNWYWLVDGLMDKAYGVHLANTAAIQQYEGLKYTDDDSDARWLAHLFRLGVLPEGYIYPKEERAVRDLLRKRSQLVRQKTANILSIQNLYSRNTGHSISGNRIKQLTSEAVDARFTASDLALAIKANLTVMRTLETQIGMLEGVVKERIKVRPAYRYLLSASGIGQILALTIMLETGDIRRFAEVGNFASYCRCVGSEKLSNGKRKGSGNTKNGNKYLAWAFVEAANFAIRFEPLIARYYQRKKAKSHRVVALKAVAHKLARACYYVMRDEVPFDVNRAFA
jgi:transposase